MTRRALPLLAAAALVAGCGGDGGTPASSASVSPAAAQEAMAARFAAKDLSFHYVRCVDGGARRGAETVFRCNVNFGEPHIEGYCVVVRGGRAVTQVEDPSLRCRRTRTGDEP
jgi:hypothetical protein